MVIWVTKSLNSAPHHYNARQPHTLPHHSSCHHSTVYHTALQHHTTLHHTTLHHTAPHHRINTTGLRSNRARQTPAASNEEQSSATSGKARGRIADLRKGRRLGRIKLDGDGTFVFFRYTTFLVFLFQALNHSKSVEAI